MIRVQEHDKVIRIDAVCELARVRRREGDQADQREHQQRRDLSGRVRAAKKKTSRQRAAPDNAPRARTTTRTRARTTKTYAGKIIQDRRQKDKRRNNSPFTRKGTTHNKRRQPKAHNESAHVRELSHDKRHDARTKTARMAIPSRRG